MCKCIHLADLQAVMKYKTIHEILPIYLRIKAVNF